MILCRKRPPVGATVVALMLADRTKVWSRGRVVEADGDYLMVLLIKHPTDMLWKQSPDLPLGPYPWSWNEHNFWLREES